jgi:tRNA (uracil-5-)-methyltransferase TRM9
MMLMDPPKPDTTTAMPRPYEVYFSSGSYDLRYPRPNPRVLAHALRLLTSRSHVIDYGCGSGRYLLALKDHVRLAAGFDISATALDLLEARLAATGGGAHLLGPEPGAVGAHVARHGPADLVLCLFGVLGHVLPQAARAEVLAEIRAALAPGGRLLLSVPNRRRRFHREQRLAGGAAEGAITYSRRIAGGAVRLPYQLFDPARLRAELNAAGFAIEGVWAESLLPEAWLLGGVLPALVDGALAPLCPARWGYGILAEARRA